MAKTLNELDSVARRQSGYVQERYFRFKREYEAAQMSPDDIALALEGFLWSVFEEEDD